MAALPGKNMAVKVSTTTIGFTDSVTWNNNIGTAETTAFGDDSKAFIPTIKDFSISISGTYDKSDSGQDTALWTEVDSGDGAIADLRIYVSAANYWGGAAVLTGTTIEGSVSDKVAYSATFVSNGDWSYT